MEKQNITRRALFASVLAVVLCFAMLIGTTFAWFTDTASSKNNKIEAGTLDIEFGVKDATKVEDYTMFNTADGTAIFTADEKWEPGYTVAKNVMVQNNGTLALKYNMTIAPTGTVSALANVIDVYYAKTEISLTTRDLTGLTKIGTLADVIKGTNDSAIISDKLEPNGTGYGTIVLKMQETAGNEYQDLAIGSDFTINVNATQYTYESDSFDNQYDKDAPLPVSVGTVAELNTALAADERDIVINLTSDISTNNINAGTTKTQTLTVNGNGHTLTVGNTYNSTFAVANPDAKIVLNNVTLDAVRDGAPFDVYDVLIKNDVEMNDVTCNRALCIDGQITAVLNHVTINETNNAADEYALWIVAGANVTMDNCTINSVGTGTNKNRAIAIKDQYVNDPQLTTLSISNTTFASQKKAAVLVTSKGGANITWGTGNNIANVAADTSNAVWIDSDAAYRDLNNVTVTGATVIVEP